MIRTNDKLIGIGFLLLALFLFSFQDVSAKYLTAFFPVPVLVWFRFAGNLVLSVGQSTYANGMVISGYLTPRWSLQLVRSGLLVTTTLLYFSALVYLPLTTSISIFFIYPLIIAGLAPHLLGERLPSERWILIVVGFVGVLLVMRPGTAAFSWPMLLVVCAAMTFSLFSILTRKLANTEPFHTTNLYTPLVGTVGLLPALLLLGGSWQAPTSIWIWLLALSMGVLFGGLGHFFLLHAHRHVPAPELAPWFYTQIFWMVVAGYVFFGDFPDLYTIAGCGLVITSSIIVLRLELRSARRLAAAQAISSID